jgi:hypothetical protein
VRRAGSVLRGWCWTCCLGVGLLLGAGDVQAQNRGIRFEITQVGDTTFRFPRGRATWVKPTTSGIAVDPRRRDILVARFRVMKVDSGLVTALITGMTTRVTTDHIAVITEPPKPWYKGITFWGGAVFGFVIGALVR